MEKLENKALTTKYTEIWHGEMNFNAPHDFEVRKAGTEEVLQRIHFQEGPIKECDVNGVANEDLIGMVIKRIEGFQDSSFNCYENAMALDALYNALMWFRKRTENREKRGVEGTNIV